MAIFSIRGEIRVFSHRNFVISVRIFIFVASYFSLLILIAMPRTYDRLIRYYDSWFGDLLDPDKGFTPEECWAVIIAIRECQRELNLEPLKNLPLNIKRGLQMRTLETQILKILEHTGKMAARGAAGGNATKAAMQKQSMILEEKNERKQAQMDEYFKKKEANRPSQEQIDLWVKVGVLDENLKPGKLWAERGRYALPDTLEKWKKMAEQQKQTSNA